MKPTTKLYFVRHGESEANTLRVISNREHPHALTELGRQQARALAESLSAVPVSSIFSSPLLRAQETADILARHFGGSHTVTDALREYDCGVLEGRSDRESWRLHHEVFTAWLSGENRARRPDGGESYEDIRTRFVPFVERLGGSSGGHIVLVGHGGLFGLMLPHVLTNVDAAFVRARGLGHTDCVVAERQADGYTCLHWGPLDGQPL